MGETDRALLLELDKLKQVYRKSYLSDQSRNENSAEHSWHLAMTFLALKPWLPETLNVDHAIKLSLTHDICEIGPGDVCAYHADASKSVAEEDYLNSLKQRFPVFGEGVLELWREYEDQKTPESHWVKVFDKLLPFVLNLASEGRTWQEQGIIRDDVVAHNAFIESVSPEIHAWITHKIQEAVGLGWLPVCESTA